MDRHRNTNLNLFLVASLALSAIVSLVLTGCSLQGTTTPTITAASPVATDQSTAQAKATLSPAAAATISVSRATRLLILHTNDVSGYVDPCG